MEHRVYITGENDRVVKRAKNKNNRKQCIVLHLFNVAKSEKWLLIKVGDINWRQKSVWESYLENKPTNHGNIEIHE